MLLIDYVEFFWLRSKNILFLEEVHKFVNLFIKSLLCLLKWKMFVPS